MSGRLPILYPALLLLILAIASCQSNPTIPDNESDSLFTFDSGQQQAQSHMCLGWYQFQIDKGSQTIDVIPLRSNQLHLNVTGILNTTMGVSAVGVPSEHDPPNGLFVFDVTLTHPFGTKPQLSGFDVKGILMTPGSLGVGSLYFADVDETQLENADGYTRWWNPSEFTSPGMFGYTQGILANATGGQLTATVNPYKLFADKLSAWDSLAWVVSEPLDSDEGRAVFRAGSSNTRRYEIRFPMAPGPQVTYGYAIDASWNIPTPNPPSEVPDDFPMNANQPEAYRVVAQQVGNSLYFDSESGVGGGMLKLQVNVHDWQGQAAGNYQAEIGGVRVYSPDLMSGGVDGVFLNESWDKARYTASLFGLASPAEAGEALVAVKVTSEGGLQYNQGLGKPAPSGDVAAWQTLIVDVTDPSCTADANNDFNESILMDFEEPTIDQLCGPTDYKDYFKLEIPYGSQVTGDLVLYCDVEPSKIQLYDSSETMITEEQVVGGVATLDMDGMGIMPSDYYVVVQTQSLDTAFLYMLEPVNLIEDVTPSDAVDVTPDDLFYHPLFLCTYGTYLYALDRNNLWIYDYVDNWTVEFKSWIPVDCDLRPVLAYPYLFIHDATTVPEYLIHVVDVSDPENPIILPVELNMTDAVWTMTVDEDYLYVATFDSVNTNVDIFSFDNLPSELTFQSTFLMGSINIGVPTDMKIATVESDPTRWLLFNVNQNTLPHCNVTDIHNVGPTSIWYWGAASWFNDFEVVDDLVYFHISDGASYSLEIIQMTAGGITPRGSVSLPWDQGFVEVQDDYAYVAYYVNNVLSDIDVSDPDNPGPVDDVTINTPITYSFESSGDYLYHAIGPGGLQLSIIYEPGSISGGPDIIGIVAPRNFRIEGEYIYEIESHLGYNAVKSVDISDPANAYLADELKLNRISYYLDVEGDKLIIGCSDGYVVGIDCSDPENLSEVNAVYTADFIGCVGMTESVLYVGAQSFKEMTMWNLSGWPSITASGFMSVADYILEFNFKDGAMYALLMDGSILVFSLADPLSPVYQTTYTALGVARDIEVDGDYLYISTSGSLEIADISNPLAPVFHASETDPAGPNGQFVTVDNQFAYLQPFPVAEVPSAVRVWPPDDPVVTGQLYDTSNATTITGNIAHDGYYYETVYDRGIRIWDLY